MIDSFMNVNLWIWLCGFHNKRTIYID